MANQQPIKGYGLMGFTWRAEPVPDEQAFEAMREAVKQGATHWSTADFYGPPGNVMANIKLLKRYFEKYPEDAQKVTIYVKSCLDTKTFKPECSTSQVNQYFERVSEMLGNVKRIDYFGPARRDTTTPLRETMEALKALVDSGKIDGILMSEIGAKTIAEAHDVYPIGALEVELSLWARDLLTNGVADAVKQRNIRTLAYSPLGRGLLTGQITSLDEIPQGDARHRYDRFQGENMQKNVALVQKLVEFSKSIGATPAQLAISWVYAQSQNVGTVIPIPGATKASRVQENTKLVSLTKEQLDELQTIMSEDKVGGGRANKHVEHMLWA